MRTACTRSVASLTLVAGAFALPSPAALGALRIGFERATQDADFVKETMKRNGVPYRYVAVPRGQSIIRDLAGVSPTVTNTLRAAVSGQN